MDKRSKLLFISNGIPTFTKIDIDILKTEFEVVLFSKLWGNKFSIFINQISLFIKLFFLRKKISKIVISFAGHWSYFPSIFGKLFKIPVAIILHGTDCSSLPSLNYGDLRKPILKRIIKSSIKNASILLPVSETLIKVENLYNGFNAERFQGIKSFFYLKKLNFRTIYNGVDSNFWIPNPKIKKKNSFIAVFTNKQFFLKGGDLIVGLAKEFPKCSFYIAGCDTFPSQYPRPNNITLLGYISNDKLLEYFNQSQFHLQLSVFEGFGCSLVESMMCNCIPIGSKVNIIPHIIGDTGVILEKRNQQDLNKIIQNLITSSKKELSKRFADSRTRAIVNFDIEIRKNKLINTIMNING
jgi:glycosyltransferase involved in cell wall biosynthesis